VFFLALLLLLLLLRLLLIKPLQSNVNEIDLDSKASFFLSHKKALSSSMGKRMKVSSSSRATKSFIIFHLIKKFHSLILWMNRVDARNWLAELS